MAEVTTTAGNNSISAQEHQAVRAHLMVVWYVAVDTPALAQSLKEIKVLCNSAEDIVESGLGKFLSSSEIGHALDCLDGIGKHLDSYDKNRTDRAAEEMRRQLRNVAAILPKGDK